MLQYKPAHLVNYQFRLFLPLFPRHWSYLPIVVPCLPQWMCPKVCMGSHVHVHTHPHMCTQLSVQAQHPLSLPGQWQRAVHLVGTYFHCFNRPQSIRLFPTAPHPASRQMPFASGHRSKLNFQLWSLVCIFYWIYHSCLGGGGESCFLFFHFLSSWVINSHLPSSSTACQPPFVSGFLNINQYTNAQ